MNMIYLLIALIILYLVANYFLDNKESFDVVISDETQSDVRRVNLYDFFKFIDYYQVVDLDPRDKDMTASCSITGEAVGIGNDIRDLLKQLYFIVNANNKDNFYSRFLIMKVGPNLEYSNAHAIRRLNYDEMIRNRIGTQFTFMPSNELDLYDTRPNINSENQYPLPASVNVHNYYADENVEVNLIALKKLLELIHENNHAIFGDLVRPTEHISFEYEFLLPLKSIRNSMYRIINTRLYKEYLQKQQFRLEYQEKTY